MNYLRGRKVVRGIDNFIDTTINIFLLLFIIVGSCFLYDSEYVFNHARADMKRFQMVDETTGETVVVVPDSDEYIGWLNFPETAVDFPVMQGQDNLKYLNTNPYGEYSLSGSIFMDFRNSSDVSDDYVLIYGHHMSGEYMFGALDAFKDREFFETHRLGTLKTVSGKEYELKTFAFLTTDASEEAIFDTSTNVSPFRYASQIADIYREDVDKDARVIALTTCKSPTSTLRTVILATINDSGDSSETETLLSSEQKTLNPAE